MPPSNVRKNRIDEPCHCTILPKMRQKVQLELAQAAALAGHNSRPMGGLRPLLRVDDSI